ncbi:serine/threonine-protein kinase [Mycolicibacterium goodii]|uniref:serine/threonine-protein kinase n=1 Tax=Mycolicibacterium goodii TaxID=134601 RepID=UPI0027E02CBB|nr:serine/threonine-protein kinase [Mycolicibacterium goodii]
MGVQDKRVGTRFGRYEIIRLLGKGGMGSVYEARDASKNRFVALKILADEYSQDPEYRTRFTREAHAAAELQEPHIIPIHDWGEIDGSLYIDMRLVRGATLRELLATGPLHPQRAVHVVGQVAAALDDAHKAGLFHRDVKPENIIVTGETDFAYLLDFGIAERIGEDHITKAGMTVGSMAYMAPERLNGQATTAACDVYALACVLYETLTGERPFGTASMQHLLTAHLKSAPPQPSRANPRLSAFDPIIARGMAKEPDERYGTAGALARAAGRALTTPPAVPVPADQMETMAGPFVLAPTDVHTRVAPPTPPATGVPTSPPVPSATGPNWPMIGLGAFAVAALVLAIGLVIGMTSANRTNPSALTAQPSPSSHHPVALPTATVAADPTTSWAAAPPPLVTGADANHRRCDAGFAHPTQTGPGSRAGRGSTATTCLFTYNVLLEYWRLGPPDKDMRIVNAYGAVPCNPSKAQCLGDQFVMECQDHGQGWITCEGGDRARVFIF